MDNSMEKLTKNNMYYLCRELVEPEDMAHRFTDLYVKKDLFTEAIMRHYDENEKVTLISEKTGDWYCIPDAYLGNVFVGQIF